jgi:hypothetical protein
MLNWRNIQYKCVKYSTFYISWWGYQNYNLFVSAGGISVCCPSGQDRTGQDRTGQDRTGQAVITTIELVKIRYCLSCPCVRACVRACVRECVQLRTTQITVYKRPSKTQYTTINRILLTKKRLLYQKIALFRSNRLAQWSIFPNS